MNRFPADFSAPLTGFGGDPGLDRDGHRRAIRKTPVILVHGNAGHSAHPTWGMETMRGFLKDLAGYRDAEIWAMDYLGENNDALDLSDPHRNRIAGFRAFVDQVREYLGVETMDFIAHSLGCGMVNGYLRGLRPDGAWDNDDHRLDVASTFVSLAGATYGLGPGGSGEFRTGSPFEVASHRFDGVVDDTPRGEENLAEQESPEPAWKKTSSLDNDAIRYVAVTAVRDFVDAQNPDTGRREGANLNKRFNLGLLDGHEKVIKSQTVFAAFKDHLNANPPVAPAAISVDKESGSYGPGMRITATISPATSTIEFVADRVAKRFNGGFIERTVAETRSGTLSDGGTLTLDTDGLWEVVFSAAGAEAVRRTYGVNITLPVVTILTDNSTPFRGSLDVSASTTRGTLFHSTNRQNWLAGSVITIDRTATVSFVAIDSDGIASAEASRAFEKRPASTDQRTATVTQHFIAGRLTVDQYVAMGLELGFNAVVTLFLIDGAWTLNAAEPRPLRSQPLPADGRLAAAPAAAAPGPGVSVRADVPSGERDGAFDVTIVASGPDGGPATVFYTVDGSDPSDRNNDQRRSFEDRKTFTFEGVGSHAVLCFAQDEARSEVFDAFAWTIRDKGYPG